ncbi:PIR protein [Plasmodium yoelii]|uniref:PIR protein n=2 Tax=Plasmodium yoelii TaxID=5861 RepID=A0AAF0B248_PLAYO|nr:PIR protein [Plasmodium yoelii]XP_034493315.1 PIR protein [Plasmodium yoelii]WBY54383.1 PIR protein [Plasmodium yoelii yoelii]WBY57043.1 PIR protein [Plasmodium yoelii yoelii]VTZ71402.1 PIR protein [Plasmodium yoelii]VTZ77950.1 PIR protein [Plasmodium yoelii]|eukprot:XP_022810826.1 PIR protein [Plasmodium yoelii]
MNDELCGKLDLLRKYLSDELDKAADFELEEITDYKNYCPGNNCNSETEKITVGFLWLLGHYYSMLQNKSYDENNTNAFFLYIISWFSYQLNQSTKHNTTKIYDFYNSHVKNNDKYEKFINDSGRYTGLNDFIDKQKDLLNINIKDLSKFYDASKLICSMYGNVAQSQTGEILSNNVKEFVKKYTELKNTYNDEGSPHSKILSVLSTDYNNLKNRCKHIQSLPEITEFSALASTYEFTSSSSSTGNKLFTVLSIFGAIAFFLGISYKYSLFGFRKRFKKQQIREKIKNIKKKMNR